MEIYLVRHGETISNRERRYQGWTESPLSTEGVRQAEKTALFFAGLDIEAIYCSDLQRAVSTARVIGASCGLHPVSSALLREIHFGRWEGLTFEEIEAQWGEEISLWLDNPFNRSAPGGETLAEVGERVLEFLHGVAGQEPRPQKIAVVTHGGSIRALLYRILDLDRNNFWDIKIENASITMVRLERDCYRLVYYNRVDHLEAGGREREAAGGE